MNRSTERPIGLWEAVAIAALAAIGACSGGGDEQAEKGKAKGPPTVGYFVAQPSRAALVVELAGRTAAYESSEVRPQVTGLIRRRFFTEGQVVRQGQPLYEIDPRLYRAAVAEADANVANARATQEAARIQANRFRPLAEIEAVSQQEYTNAVAAARQATASVAQTRAQRDTARINLKFTTVPAPISGRIGRSLFTVGALVSATQADPLAQIQRLDPIFVDIQQSSADLVSLRRSLARDGIIPTQAVVRLRLEDGSDYGSTGTVEFSEALVNVETGTVTLRARFPNPTGLLLPGMFVRTSFAQAINTRAFIVPQAAVSRDPKGAATVMVVGRDNKVTQRTVRADRTEGTAWVVTQGLNEGDRIVVQGLGAQLRPGMTVKAVPAGNAQRVAPPPSDGGQTKAGAR